MLSFYPPIKPYAVHTVSVEKPHELYVEESGNPDGVPVIFVHGGPGGGCNEDQRCYFDPNLYRIVLFDQRGAGRSTPHAELASNNTQALVSDMEQIREMLGIDRWVVFGGSWGSTLGLVYAETHPERVRGLILRGIFLNRKHDIDWLYNGKGANFVFPDFYEEFTSIINHAETIDYVSAYYKLLTGEDEVARMAAAKAWSSWEARCSTLEPDTNTVDSMTEPHTALSLARIEAHYFYNDCFLKPNQILANVHKIADIPGIIVHGRYDMVCSLENAWELNKSWPNSVLNIIRDAGHSSREPGTVDALIRATQAMSKL